MAVTVPTSVTGGAQTGFTSPTYTAVAGTFPGYNGKQNYVTAIGGTQAGVRVHSATDPFTLAFWAPQTIKPAPVSVNGSWGKVPVNVYGLNVRKGVYVASGAPTQIAQAKISFEIPAGAEAYDAANVRALCSCLVGFLNSISAGAGDTLVSGQP